MNKLLKGFAAAALVLVVSPAVGLTSPATAQAAPPSSSTVASNPECDIPAGSYNGGVCKVIHPPYVETAPAQPSHPIYQEWPGKKTLTGEPSLNHQERSVLLAEGHRRIVDECKSYTPYTYRFDPAAWTRFCANLPAPTVPYFQVQDVVTGALR